MGVPCGRFAAGAGRIASLEPSWLYVPSSASMTCVRSGVATLCFCRFGDRDLALERVQFLALVALRRNHIVHVPGDGII